METLKLNAFLDFHFIGNVKTAPDESRYGFVAAQAHEEKNEYHHTLYLVDNNEVKKVRKLKKNNAFIFLNNHHLLLDLQKNKQEETALKEKANQSFYRYDIQEKTLEKAFTLPIRANIEAVINDHVLLVSSSMTVEDHILYEGTKEQRDTYLKEKKKSAHYEDIDEIPYYYNGRNFVTGQQKQLFLYDTSTETLKRIVDKAFGLEQFTLTEDKKTIFYTGKAFEKVTSFTSKIYAYDVETDEHKTLYDQIDYNIVKLIEMNDKLVVAARDMKRYGLNQNPDFFVLEDNRLTLLAKHGQSMGNTVGSDCRLLGTETSFVKDKIFYFVTTIDDHCELKALTLDGTLSTVFEMPGSIDGFVKYQDKAIMVGLKDQQLQEVFDYHFVANTIKQVTDFNKKALNDVYVATPQKLVVKKDTHEVKGYVLLPQDYDENKQYPLVLNIHGGPKTVYGSVYYHEMQYWANAGYVVIFANPRGSDGKGDAFADIRGKYGSIDYEDLMAFTDLAIETYKGIDEKNLYVTGGSYGGFMTNWMVGHTDRFKAAATQRSISNWLSFYGTSDIGYFFASDQTDGHPLDDMDKLYEQSPIKYAKNIKTPLLFIHSDKDHRCPMEQAQQLYAILKTRGIDTKLIWFKEETHELSRSGKPQARVKRLTDITEWFKTH